MRTKLLALFAMLIVAASAQADVRIGRSRGVVGGAGAALFGGRRAVVVAPHAAVAITAAPLRFAPIRRARVVAPLVVPQAIVAPQYFVQPQSFVSPYSFQQFRAFSTGCP